VRDINSEWFGVNWDSGNFRGEDAYGELKAIAPYAVTAQIKTKVGGKPADFARVVKILQDVNYRGWVALEYEDEEEPKNAVPRYLAELRKIVTSQSVASRG